MTKKDSPSRPARERSGRRRPKLVAVLTTIGLAAAGCGGTNGQATRVAGGGPISGPAPAPVNVDQITGCLTTFKSADGSQMISPDLPEYAFNPEVTRQVTLSGGEVDVWTYTPADGGSDQTALTLYMLPSARAVTRIRDQVLSTEQEPNIWQNGTAIALINGNITSTVSQCLPGFKPARGNGAAGGGVSSPGDSEAAAKSMARTAQVAAETYAVGHNGSYSGLSIKALQSLDPSLTGSPGSGIYLNSVSGTPSSYSVAVASPANEFRIEVENGTVTRTCDNASGPGCANGNW